MLHFFPLFFWFNTWLVTGRLNIFFYVAIQKKLKTKEIELNSFLKLIANNFSYLSSTSTLKYGKSLQKIIDIFLFRFGATWTFCLRIDQIFQIDFPLPWAARYALQVARCCHCWCGRCEVREFIMDMCGYWSIVGVKKLQVIANG